MCPPKVSIVSLLNPVKLTKQSRFIPVIVIAVSRKNPVPVLLEPFSHEEPCCPGQNPVVLAAVHKIFELTENRSVLVVDRGFDGWVMFEDWLDNTYRFVARLVGKRHLLRFYSDSGQWLPLRAETLAEQTPTPH